MFAFIDDNKNTRDLETIYMVSKDTATFDNYLADRYISLMQDLVFTPAGVAKATCTPEIRYIQTLMYNETTPATPGIVLSDWKLTCGGGGRPYIIALEDKNLSNGAPDFGIRVLYPANYDGNFSY